ncbi:MAG: NAD(+) synthase [Tidjanibacter sp.]|nr:NAD(+) synthase [Tidjanibacter sp.]
MKIAIAQINYLCGNFEYNKYKIIDAITHAKEEGADLVVFAEQAITGVPAHSLLVRGYFLGKAEETLVEIAAYTDDIAILVGLPIHRNGGTVSAAAFIQNRRIKRYITKRSLQSDVDAAYLNHGRGHEYIHLAGEKIAVAVGGDFLSDHDFSDASTIVVMGADRYQQGRIERRYDYLAEKAFMADANVIFVNHIGGSSEIVYDGSSAMFNAKGKCVALLGSFVEEIAFVDTQNTAMEIEVPYQDKSANVYGALKLGISDYFDKNHPTEKACVVLTGGIDSSVAAVILADALGSDRVVGMLMPSTTSNPQSISDAAELAKTLGIELVTVPLSDIYSQALPSIVAAIGEPDVLKLEEDFQLRLRTALFMAVCEHRGCVPINSANKTELAVGALTLYGNTSGMIGLLGDLYKSDVYALARHINSRREIISEHTLLKTPSSEMQVGSSLRTLPPYDVIDAILYRMLERWQDQDEIVDAGFDVEDVQLVRSLVYASLEKVFQFCPIVEVSSVPLDKSYVDLPTAN